MAFNYFIDESGNSGDLIKKKFDLKFGNQPLFALACIGVFNQDKTNCFFNELMKKHAITNDELKSSNLYFQNPQVFHDLFLHLKQEKYPLLVELVDKKFCIATQIVNHLIFPPYFMPDESDGSVQYIRNGIADYISTNLPDNCYEAFFNACNTPSNQTILNAMETLKSFFLSKNSDNDFAELTASSIDESIDDYNILKARIGETEAVKKFIPIPDKTKNGLTIKLLPHVHSTFNLLARLNRFHNKELHLVNLYHDKQNEFDYIIQSSKEMLENMDTPYSGPPVFHSDYELSSSAGLDFLDSKSSIGIQLADLTAGFINRYVNGYLYKQVDMKDIYHETFKVIVNHYNRISPLGINFVIPQSMQEIIFRKYSL